MTIVEATRDDGRAVRVVIDGPQVTFVYDDDLVDLLAAGTSARVARASLVEPHPTRLGWVADMTISDGPVLGTNGEMLLTGESVWPDGPHARAAWDALEPFARREDALLAERNWLRTHRGL